MDIMSSITEILNAFCYQTSLSVLYVIIYVAALVVIVRSRDKLLCQTLALPVIIAAFTLFNPLVYMFVIKGSSVEGIYGRLFWFCMVFVVDAFALAWVTEKQESMGKTLLVLAVCVVAVVSGGGAKTWYVESENIYKIPQQVIEMDEVITAVKEEENPTIVCDEDVYFYLRQYDPSVITYGNIGYLTKRMSESMEEETRSIYEDFFGFMTGDHGYSEELTVADVERVITMLGIDMVCAKTNQLDLVVFEAYEAEQVYAEDGQYIYKIIRR